MPNTKVAKKAQLERWLAAFEGPITPEELVRIHLQFAPISENYLRKLLRESGHKMHPLVEGVRQDTYENLERTLNCLEEIYSAGDALEKSYCRQLVKQAKQRAELAARRYRGSRSEKIEWMRLWLENPAAFPRWAQFRRHAIENRRA